MYSVTSILNALESNKDLTVENAENIGCPLPKEDSLRDPDNCEKGNNQNCKQPVACIYAIQKINYFIFQI
jgi:hypothetical protein